MRRQFFSTDCEGDSGMVVTIQRIQIGKQRSGKTNIELNHGFLQQKYIKKTESNGHMVKETDGVSVEI
jgi:hypothetical protein